MLIRCKSHPIMNFINSSLFKWFELVLIFVGVPIIYYLDLIPFHKSIPLLTFFFIFLIVLIRDKSFNSKIFRFSKFANWNLILIRFIIFSIISFVLIYFFAGNNLFYLPREKMDLWLLIIVSYPVWSAYPQELIYRAYFFHRYKDLIKKDRLLIFINAILFSFSHIIFENWIAIGLTFLGGIMFSITYKKSNSLMVVFTEHTLYGIWIFTVGAGQYFYAPTVNS